MGRLLAALLGAFGVFTFWRRRRKPKRAEPAVSPADELREKLAETRASESEPEAEVEPALESDLEARRREVHERARGAIDDLR